MLRSQDSVKPMRLQYPGSADTSHASDRALLATAVPCSFAWAWGIPLEMNLDTI